MQYILESKVIKTCAFEIGLDWTELCGKKYGIGRDSGIHVNLF